MIGQEGTVDGQIIKERGFGLNIDLNNLDATVEQIQRIDRRQIRRWRERLLALPAELYTLTNDHEKLKQCITDSR